MLTLLHFVSVPVVTMTVTVNMTVTAECTILLVAYRVTVTTATHCADVYTTCCEYENGPRAV